jgi:uncharacterized protein YkwD
VRRRNRAIAAACAALLVAVPAACAGGELTVVDPSAGPGGPGGAGGDEPLGITATTASSTTTSTSTSTSTSTTTSTTTTVPATTTTTEAPPPPPPPPNPDRTWEERSLAFVNQKRSENGAGALQMDPDLTAMAEGWAGELVNRQDLGHNPNLGEQIPDRFRAWGENVAYSYSADNIDQMWWESDGHRANILGSSYDSIGIAFTEDGNGQVWAVQVFGGT